MHIFQNIILSLHINYLLHSIVTIQVFHLQLIRLRLSSEGQSSKT